MNGAAVPEDFRGQIFAAKNGSAQKHLVKVPFHGYQGGKTIQAFFTTDVYTGRKTERAVRKANGKGFEFVRAAQELATKRKDFDVRKLVPVADSPDAYVKRMRNANAARRAA